MRKERWDADARTMIVTDEEEQVNQASALWARPKSEISEEQYHEFYKHVAHDDEPPLAFSHARVEGRQEYTQLLFIPGRAPYDLWDREHRRGIKLYVQRVFIMDDAKQLMPEYLRFVRGVIDSNDLPLNVSREILQQSKIVETIRAASVKRVLGLLDDLAAQQPEKYADLLEGVRPRVQGRHRRGSRQQGARRRAAAVRHHARRPGRTDGVARRLRRPDEGRSGRYLLRDRRRLPRRGAQPASRDLQEERGSKSC